MAQIKKGDTVETVIETATIKRGSRLLVVRIDGPIVFCESGRGNEVWYDADRNEVKSIGY